MLKLIAVAGLCLSAGCRTPTMGAVLQEKSRGGGSSRVYRTSPKQAWEIALQVLRWEGAGTIEEHHEGQFMLTTIYDRYAASAIGPMSYAGVWVEPASGGAEVTCVVDGQSFTEARFHRRFAQAVAFLEGGKALPLAAPREPPEDLQPCASASDCEIGVCVEGRCRR